ncbi:cornifelin homolog B-like [Melanotaenia boesemani]|uniref:cornifelin homolog B-like n=1 Tax=Melanotaenia boesemani TaxID=1250792 RepID=UPI001C05B5E9|nr:cornifelin homolog B-like [Melanotaenia boesemani]
MAQQSSSEWSSGLFDCLKEPRPCLCAFCCLPLYAAPIAKEYGEHPLLPLLDILGPAGLSLFGIPVFVPPVALSLRTAMRRKYGIKGTMGRDIMLTCFCNFCVWCQMGRERTHRENGSTTQTRSPVTVQPGASNN